MKDRMRHTLLFEVGLVMLLTPIASLVLEKDILRIGGMTVILSVTAMLVNYFFNLAFDHVLLRLGHSLLKRSVITRIVHAILFEASLLVIALPLIAFTLEVSVWQAFLADIGFSVFALVYAFGFNWIYDHYCPLRYQVAT